LIRNACKKYDKLAFQVGTQQRADSDGGWGLVNAYILIQKGLLGDIQKVTCHIPRSGNRGPWAVAPVPETFDWEMWQGQTPRVEYRVGRAHSEFRYWYEYSGGTLTDWGAHHVDCAMWIIGQNGPGQGPVKFKPILAEHPVPFEKGYPTLDDRHNTCTIFDIECTFANGIVMNITSEGDNGILFEGTKGRIHVGRHRINGAPMEAIKDELDTWITPEDYRAAFKGKNREWLLPNFITCVKEGGMPVSDVFTHVQAVNACHLAAISARLNREVIYDPKTETTGDSESQTFLARQRTAGYDIPDVGGR